MRRQATNAAWLAEFAPALTATTRALHSMQLYEEMIRRAGVVIRPNLFTVLVRLAELQPARASDVADNTGYDPSTVSRQVAELVELGYVARVRDTRDGRAVVLTVTPAGQASVDRVFRAWEEFLADLTADWSADDRDSFLRQLRRLSTSLLDRVGTA